jgi:hypothetical protein
MEDSYLDSHMEDQMNGGYGSIIDNMPEDGARGLKDDLTSEEVLDELDARWEREPDEYQENEDFERTDEYYGHPEESGDCWGD